MKEEEVEVHYLYRDSEGRWGVCCRNMDLDSCPMSLDKNEAIRSFRELNPGKRLYMDRISANEAYHKSSQPPH